MGSGRLKAALAAFFLSFQAHALDPAAVEKLAFGDGDEKIEAIGALVAEGDPKAAELLKAFAEGVREGGLYRPYGVVYRVDQRCQCPRYPRRLHL